MRARTTRSAFTGGVTYAITTRPITVTAAAKTKVYGDSDPALTFTTSSLGTGVAVDGSLTRTAGETVASSPYPILQGTVTNANNPNYAITYVGANFTITTRPITVTAAAKTKIYGDSDPALTFTTSSLGTGVAIVGSLTRTAGETVASSPYPILQGTVTNANNPNYSITYVGASLSITPRPVTVTPNSGQSKYFGAGDPVLTYTLSLPIGVSGALGRVAGEAVGSYAITLGSLASTSSNFSLVLATSVVNFTILGWTIQGFEQPVDMGMLNTVKGGSTVPLKFKVFSGATEVTTVASVKGFKATLVNCTAFIECSRRCDRHHEYRWNIAAIHR